MLLLNDEILTEGKRYAQYFKSMIEHREMRLASGSPATDEVYSTLCELRNVFCKLKDAFIYGNYHVNTNILRELKYIIAELEYCREIFEKNISAQGNMSPGVEFGASNNAALLSSVYKGIKEMAAEYISIGDKELLYSENKEPGCDVLVGSMRSPNQLEVAKRYHFYHIPAKLVENPDNIKCIALYQSKALFGNKCGIKYYGRVKAYEKLPRCEISRIKSNSKELYYKFKIEKWKILKKPIEADHLGSVATLTSLFLLMHAKKASELLLTTREEYRLYEFMRKHAFSPFAGNVSVGAIGAVYDGRIFKFSKDGMPHLTVTNEDFAKDGVSQLKQILKKLGFLD